MLVTLLVSKLSNDILTQLLNSANKLALLAGEYITLGQAKAMSVVRLEVPVVNTGIFDCFIPV